MFQHTRVILWLLEIQCTRFKFIHVLNFPLFVSLVSMGMFYNDFGTMETKDKIEPHHNYDGHSSGSLFSKKINIDQLRTIMIICHWNILL